VTEVYTGRCEKLGEFKGDVAFLQLRMTLKDKPLHRPSMSTFAMKPDARRRAARGGGVGEGGFCGGQGSYRCDRGAAVVIDEGIKMKSPGL
jgi:hypothetical protein